MSRVTNRLERSWIMRLLGYMFLIYMAVATMALAQKTVDPINQLEELDNQAVKAYQAGDYHGSSLLVKKAYEVARQTFGDRDQRTLTHLNNLAFMHEQQNRYEEAEPLYKKVLQLRRDVLGPHAPDTLQSLKNLAALYVKQGRYGEAEPLSKEALQLRRRVLGPRDIATLTSLSELALLYGYQGRYSEAEPLSKEALQLHREVLGPRHPNTLTSLNNLADLYRRQGRNSEAEPLSKEALQLHREVLGPRHPNTLASLNNLAVLYRRQGRNSEAEPLSKEALQLHREVLGPRHPNTLTSLHNLVALYGEQGRHDGAEPLHKEVLHLRREALGPRHPDTLLSLQALATLYVAQGRYGEAEPLLKEVLQLRREELGPRHPDTLFGLNNLGSMYWFQGRYGEAEPLLKEVLQLRHEELGPRHPDTLASLYNLANLYFSQGHYAEAESLYKEALQLYREMLGPRHPRTLNTQLHRVLPLINLDRREEAVQQLLELEPQLLGWIGTELYGTQEESSRRRLIISQMGFQVVALNLALQMQTVSAKQLAGVVMLRWKQLQGDQEAYLARLARHSKDVQVRNLAQKIATLRGQLSALMYAGKDDEAVKKTLAELEKKEHQLSQKNSKSRNYLQVRIADLGNLSSKLPAGGALLELRQYWPMNFRKLTVNEGNLVEPHWAAFLLPASGEPSLHDLGLVAETQKLWQKLQETHARTDAAALYNQLFSKLDDQLKRYDPLYIAPDDFLSLLSFAELVTPDGRYWIQRQTLRQVSTGRHLISSENRDSIKLKGLLALGEVDYERFSNAEPVAPKEKPVPDQNVSVAMRALRQGINRFEVLKETGHEVTEVDYRYWNDSNIPSQIWRGVDASEPRLKALATPPGVLHLATHGFYLSDNEKLIENTANRPMVLSGLALAGANQGLRGKTGPDGEDGILYALEVQDLNLEDTELVTLSACDTGQGTLDYAEGVYGLTRAFRTAGARNVLMSLWPLSDRSAREFMARFYRTWLNGPKPKDLAVALRETQLFFIQNEDESLRDPRVWAPFVLIEGRGL